MRHLRAGVRAAGTALVAAAFIGGAPAALAETFPSHPIRIVVPNTPSTPPDIISRVIAAEVSRATGWNVIVENRPGGVTTIAASDVLKQAADGYSLYAMSVPSVAAPALQPNITYRVEADFEPVIKASVSYNVLVVNPAVPAHSLAELVALIKGSPDRLTFSSGGFGTPAHLIGELFKLQTGARATHVPYQVFPQAIGDLLNGTNQFMFVTMLPVVDLIKTGKLRAIAVTAPQRIAALADVPTVAEQGFASLVVEDWVGFAVRRGTPPEVVARLNDAFNQALKEASVRDALQKLGATPAGGTAKEFGDHVRSQVSLWRQVIVDSGIKM